MNRNARAKYAGALLPERQIVKKNWPGREQWRTSTVAAGWLVAALVLLVFLFSFGSIWDSGESEEQGPKCPETEALLEWPSSTWERVTDEQDLHQRIRGHRRQGFTVVLNTFKRPELMRRAIKHYSQCDGVDMIRVVWSEQIPPPTLDEDPEAFGPRPTIVRIDTHPTTSINNRFSPLADLRTDAVFNVDDDMVIPCEVLSMGFKHWLRNPMALVGFFPRLHSERSDSCGYDYLWSEPTMWWKAEYSIALTKAAFVHHRFFKLYTEDMPKRIRDYIDEHHNCEDIAMQFLVSNATGLPPVFARAPLRFYLAAKWDGVGRSGISGKKGHHEERGQCITDFSAMYGSMPLRTAPLRPRNFVPANTRPYALL